MPSYKLDSLQLSVTNPLILVGLLKTWGYNEHDLFVGTGLNTAKLSDPDGFVPLSAYLALIRRAAELTGNPAVGLELGRRINLTGSSMVGLGAMACNTLAESLYLFKRATAVLNPAVHLEITTDSDNMYLEMREAYPWGESTQVMVDTGFSIINSAVSLAAPSDLGLLSFSFAYEAQPDEAVYREFLSGTLHFNASKNSVAIPIETCSKVMPFQNEDVVTQADAWLSDHLEKLNNHRLASLIPIQKLIEDDIEVSMESVAQSLHLSPRTLNRRLKAIGTSYKDIVLNIKQTKSLELLSNRNHSVDTVAYSLGYSNPSNFSKAFKSWTGLTPSEYRQAFLETT